MTDKSTAAGALAATAFALASVLSASLIFLIEPMFARMVLPRFGGAAAVWSVALVFFQSALLAGYLYAHVLTRHFPVRKAVAIHLFLMLAGALFLPPAVRMAESGQGETFALMLVMVASLGVPFMALAANAPLLQAWFLRSGLPGAHNPWPLYAASNAGSLGALLAYPLIVEQVWGLSEQAWLWSLGYAALVLLIAVAGYAARGGGEAQTAVSFPDARQSLRWLLLSAVPSAGLVAVTAHLTTDVAAAPFLWVAPLALYLGTFVIAFGSGSDRWRRVAETLLLPVMLALIVVLAFGIRLGLASDLVLHLGGFFIMALACHARLAATRPAPQHLTAFYLVLSAGGMLGGIAAALVAPAVFSFVAEYPLAVIATAIALPRRRLPVAVLMVLVMIAGQIAPGNVTSRLTRRSFYGVHTVEVTRDGAYRTLRHGLEIHGAQKVSEPGKPTPLTYYHEESPISEAIDAMRQLRGGGALNIGVVGLGTGSIACLAEPVDRLTFFEIDPAVVAIARDPELFRFLDACAPKARVTMGDARQMLATSPERFDILIIDAFSSDAIPLHLLTREALKIYRERVGENGTIVLHISNNHLRLQDVVAATAADAGLAVLLHDEADAETGPFLYQPTVAVLAAGPRAFGALAENDEWQPSLAPSGVRGWSDDRASILGPLIGKWRER